MTISKSKLIDALQWSLTVFLLASYTIFSTSAWGRYIILLTSAMVLLTSVIKNRGWLRIRIEEFLLFFAAFTVYTALSSVWALSATDSLNTAGTLLRMLVCFAMVYWSYMDETDPYRLISAMVAASYVVAVYTVIAYGFSNIMNATDSILTTIKFANLNSIALFLALGIVCDLYLFLNRGARIYSLLSFLSIIIVAFTRSRKAIVFLVLGALLVLMFRYVASTSIVNRIIKIFLIVLFASLTVFFLAKLPIFSGVNARLEQMLNMLRGSGKIDTSTLMRSNLIQVGWKSFLERPLFGVGIGCTHIVAADYLNFDSYLHNNYIELLAGGGAAALLLYYGMYAYLLVNYFKLRKTDYQWYAFGLTVLLLTLITDYGRVSYYSDTVLFEVMVLFLICKIVSRNRKEISDSDETDQVSE